MIIFVSFLMNCKIKEKRVGTHKFVLFSLFFNIRETGS